MHTVLLCFYEHSKRGLTDQIFRGGVLLKSFQDLGSTSVTLSIPVIFCLCVQGGVGSLFLKVTSPF